MELIGKAAACAILAAMVGLLLKKQNPETALLLGAVTVLGILSASMGVLDGLRELRKLVSELLGGGEAYLAPVVKCLVIGIVTRFAADLCKDSSQSAAASAVELAGTVSAVTVVMPLLTSVLKLIGGLI